MGKSENFIFFSTYVSLKTEGNNIRCPTKGAEMGQLQTERHALEDIRRRIQDSQERIRRVQENVLKRATLCLKAGGEVAIFSTICRIPVVVLLSF